MESKGQLILRISELEGLLDALLDEAISDIGNIKICPEMFTKIMMQYNSKRVDKIVSKRV